MFLCILVYHLARELYNKKTATIALFLSVIHPNLLFHAREARVYSFFALFFLIWLFLLYRQDKRSSYNNKKFYHYALLVNSFFIVFIHPYGLLVYALLLLFALYIKSLKKWDLITFSIPLVFGVLMTGYLMSHPSTDSGSPDTGVYLEYSLLALSGINPEVQFSLIPGKINLALSSAMLLLLLVSSYKGKRFTVVVLAIFFLIFPILHSYMNIVFVQRYLIAFIPLLLIQIAYCLTRFHSYIKVAALTILTIICFANAIDVLLIEKSIVRPFSKNELSQFTSRPDAPVVVGSIHLSLLKMYRIPNKVVTLYPENFNKDQVRWVKSIGDKSFSLYSECEDLGRDLRSNSYFFDVYFPFPFFAPAICPNIYDETKKIAQIDQTNNIDRFVFYKTITLYKNEIPAGSS
tara:strand:- start:1983 stop:3197 length:1215 start_codon:yes stop_codon:yes gene_type:complete